MRICIVTLFYKPDVGGIQRYVDDLARSLSKSGNEVDIITSAFDEKERTEVEENITIYRLPSFNIFKQAIEENKKKSIDFLKFIRDYLNKRKVDIIIAQNSHVSINSVNHTLFLNMVAMEKKVPIILTIHSFPTDPFSELKIELAKSLFWDKIVTVSMGVAETFYNKGIEADRIKVIYPGIDLNLFKPNLGKKWLRNRIEGIKDKDILLLHASRTGSKDVIEQKGLPTLLKAFSLVCQRYKNAKLLIASAPTVYPFEEEKKKAVEYIKNIAKLYGIENKVKIAAFQLEEMPLVYNGSDIFVMASRLESFGMVYAEAMACGLPVIGTSVGGIPEIIVNGKCGYLIPPDNPVELSKYLSMLLADANKRKKLGSYGRKIIKSKFDINKISAKRIGHYKSLIHQKHKEKGLDIIRQIAKE